MSSVSRSPTEAMIRKLLPGFKSGHTRYVECVKTLFRDGCRWLDAGGGRRIFPDLYDGERELVARARRVVVCDTDPASLQDHVSASQLICCDLARLPLPSCSFDLITCAMVVEHLPYPAACIREMGRVLDRGGKLVIHTVNLWGYPTLLAMLSKAIPCRRKLIAGLTHRLEQDIFPTHYRCNTAGVLSKHLKAAGLQVEAVHYWDSGLLFRTVPPLALLEALCLRLTARHFLARLRGQLLAIASKP